MTGGRSGRAGDLHDIDQIGTESVSAQDIPSRHEARVRRGAKDQDKRWPIDPRVIDEGAGLNKMQVDRPRIAIGTKNPTQQRNELVDADRAGEGRSIGHPKA